MTNSSNVSVVIPVLNEHALVAEAIDAAWSAGADQVIVVDGGSTDQTHEIVQSCRCQYEICATGRGIQQNRGAELSNGDVLLFLHVDCRLPNQSIQQIRQSVANYQQLWGGFQQRINATGRIYRWIEKGNSWRVTRRQLVYGDQGIWVQRKLFEQVGGFPNQPIMEDVQLSLRLRNICRPKLLPGPITVNPRRWERHGTIRQTVKNWTLFGLYRIGVSPTRLSKLYGA